MTIDDPASIARLAAEHRAALAAQNDTYRENPMNADDGRDE